MSRGCLCPGCANRGGCWYKRAAWRRLAEAVRRSGPCYVSDCPNPVRAADHVDPVGPRTTWAEFVSRSRLRASCLRHNTARGVAARLADELAAGVRPRPHPLTAGDSIFGSRR